VVEAWITAMVAVIGGGWGVISGVHKRVTNVDSRLDRIELCLAKEYVPRNEFYAVEHKLEERMIRIEEKLDRMLERQRPS
jgi:hypothetical protein